jgi:L-histidine N-alpha-methyltransferase
MSCFVNVAIDASQFPERVRQDLLISLRTRKVNHKFHYDSVKQTQKWLALHEAYSPSRTDNDCARTYDRGFIEAARRITARRLHLIGLGCGGGQKDARLLRLLRAPARKVWYTPCDVSAAMVLTARQAALRSIASENCFPLVCDLATATDLLKEFDKLTGAGFSGATVHAARLFTFFGMIPNFEPQIIMPRLRVLLKSEDMLLFSANLAPGPDYAAGVRRILPLYDNALTRDWLLTFLLDLGVEKNDGKLDFVIEDMPLGLKRIAAYFCFSGRRTLSVAGETFTFRAGHSIRLFFSYRHTPALVRRLLARHGLEVLDQRITGSEEEGVFLCMPKKPPGSSK